MTIFTWLLVVALLPCIYFAYQYFQLKNNPQISDKKYSQEELEGELKKITSKFSTESDSKIAEYKASLGSENQEKNELIKEIGRMKRL